MIDVLIGAHRTTIALRFSLPAFHERLQFRLIESRAPVRRDQRVSTRSSDDLVRVRCFGTVHSPKMPAMSCDDLYTFIPGDNCVLGALVRLGRERESARGLEFD